MTRHIGGVRFDARGAVVGGAIVFLLAAPLLVFILLVGLPRSIPAINQVFPAPQSPVGPLDPTIRVIANARFDRFGAKGVLELVEALRDRDDRDSCMIALVRHELGLDESFKESLEWSPDSSDRAVPAPPAPAPPSVRVAPAASVDPSATGDGRVPLDDPTSECEQPRRPGIDRSQITGALALIGKINDPYRRGETLGMAFAAVSDENGEEVVDEEVVREAVNQLNEIHRLSNPYMTDRVDEIVLGDVAAAEYRKLKAEGVEPVSIPRLLKAKLRESLMKIAESDDGVDRPRYQMDPVSLAEVSDSISAQKKILVEAERNREARWWGVLATLGTCLVTSVGFVAGGLAAPILKAIGDVSAREIERRSGGAGDAA